MVIPFLQSLIKFLVRLLHAVNCGLALSLLKFSQLSNWSLKQNPSCHVHNDSTVARNKQYCKAKFNGQNLDTGPLSSEESVPTSSKNVPTLAVYPVQNPNVDGVGPRGSLRLGPVSSKNVSTLEIFNSRNPAVGPCLIYPKSTSTDLAIPHFILSTLFTSEFSDLSSNKIEILNRSHLKFHPTYLDSGHYPVEECHFKMRLSNETSTSNACFRAEGSCTPPPVFPLSWTYNPPMWRPAEPSNYYSAFSMDPILPYPLHLYQPHLCTQYHPLGPLGPCLACPGCPPTPPCKPRKLPGQQVKPCRPRIAPNPCCPVFHKGNPTLYKRIFIFICVPAIAAQIYNLIQNHHPHEKGSCRDFEYMRLRSKSYPWGDGKATFFHNDDVNHLPGECEEVDRSLLNPDECDG